MITIIGDSHTVAIKNALSEREDIECYWLNLGKGVSAIHGDITPEEAIEKIKKKNRKELLIVGLLGTQHNLLGILKHEVPFDVYFQDGSNESKKGVEYIPNKVAQELFASKIRGENYATKLLKAAKCRAAIIATPPPKNADDEIINRASNYRGTSISKETLNPAARRLRLWKLETAEMEKAAHDWGVGFLPPPTQTIDDLGFLEKDFQKRDLTHANDAYGAAVVDQIVTYDMNHPACSLFQNLLRKVWP